MGSTSQLGSEFNSLIEGLESLVAGHTDERALTAEVAKRLGTLLSSSFALPDELTRTNRDRYVMYPLHIDPQGRFSVAAAVWDVGQATPVHSHETWGVVGIYSGIEGETRYQKPRIDGEPLVMSAAEVECHSGQVSVCCLQDDDVHMVRCVGDEPCIGIHIYGSDIGTLRRRTYDPATGAVAWFTSRWEPVAT